MTQKNISLWRVVCFGKCPACGRGGLYGGLLKVVDNCKVCGFELKNHDAADGPAFFSMFLTSVIVVILVALVELTIRPPLWLHLAIWAPFTLCLSVLLLRVVKSWLIAMQYKHNVNQFRQRK